MNVAWFGERRSFQLEGDDGKAKINKGFRKYFHALKLSEGKLFRPMETLKAEEWGEKRSSLGAGRKPKTMSEKLDSFSVF